MKKDLFEEMFDYNHHSNQKLAELFIANAIANEKSIKLFSHILNSHHIWTSRIMETQSEYEVWDIQPTKILKDIDNKNFNGAVFILSHTDIDKTIRYQNSKGQGFENKISDILFHIINHSTYHRGQIATDFRKNGIEPLNTDYIFYKR